MRKLQQVWTLYTAELRGALRDRTIVVNSLLIPLLLYPLLIWLALLGVTFAVGQGESLTSRVEVSGWPPGHAGLRRELERIPQVTLVQAAEGDCGRRVVRGVTDVCLEFGPAAPSALADNFEVRIVFDKSKERSATARERIVGALGRYRERWLEREARARGLTPAEWQLFNLTDRNTASRRQMGAFLLSMLLPLLFVAMVFMGCVHPAIDATAGERERGTWETLMAAPVSRGAIVVAKYLYVATFGLVAGLLNFVSMALTVGPMLAPLMRRGGETIDLTVRPAAVPLVVLSAVLLAAFAAAGMLLFASFARTFKEGQSTITPFYMLTLVPLMLLQGQATHLDARTALVPGANVMLMVRAALTDGVAWPLAALTVVATLAVTGVFVALAAFVLRFEDFVVGSYRGTLVTMLKSRLVRPRGSSSPGGASHE